MNMQWTPGPWCVEDATQDYPVDICLGYQVPQAGCPTMIASCFYDDDEATYSDAITVKQAIANARLMAAAPDLVAALIAVDDHLTKTFPPYQPPVDSPFDKVLDKVRAALQKAGAL